MNGRTNVTGGGSNGSLGGVIPLEAPSNFTVTPDNGKCLLTWTDPKDKYADEIGEITDEGDQLVSQFAYTRIVRKTTGYPSSPDEGELVTESSTRNQYQSTAYTDAGLVNNTLYYYAAFTCNTDGVWSGSTTDSATPQTYDPILANNSWEQINDVANSGFAGSVWEVGDEINGTIINNENLTFVILDFDHDDLADGSGKAAITFGMKGLLASTRRIDSDNRDGPIGFRYPKVEIYKYITNTLYQTIPTNVSQYLREVNKTSYTNAISGDEKSYTDTFKCHTFQFSVTEIGLSLTGAASHSTLYPYYSTASNRRKGNKWSTRDLEYNDYHGMYGYDYGCIVGTNGSLLSRSNYDDSECNPENQFGVCIGFCIGKTPA